MGVNNISGGNELFQKRLDKQGGQVGGLNQQTDKTNDNAKTKDKATGTDVYDAMMGNPFTSAGTETPQINENSNQSNKNFGKLALGGNAKETDGAQLQGLLSGQKTNDAQTPQNGGTEIADAMTSKPTGDDKYNLDSNLMFNIDETKENKAVNSDSNGFMDFVKGIKTTISNAITGGGGANKSGGASGGGGGGESAKTDTFGEKVASDIVSKLGSSSSSDESSQVESQTNDSSDSTATASESETEEVKKAKQTLQSSQESLQNADSESKAAQGGVESAKKNFTQKETNVSDIEASIKDLGPRPEENDDNKDEVQAWDEKNAQLQEDLEKANAEYDEAVSTLDDACAANEEASIKLSSTQQQVQEAETGLKTAESKVTETKKQNENSGTNVKNNETGETNKNAQTTTSEAPKDSSNSATTPKETEKGSLSEVSKEIKSEKLSQAIKNIEDFGATRLKDKKTLEGESEETKAEHEKLLQAYQKAKSEYEAS